MRLIGQTIALWLHIVEKKSPSLIFRESIEWHEHFISENVINNFMGFLLIGLRPTVVDLAFGEEELLQFAQAHREKKKLEEKLDQVKIFELIVCH